MVEQANEALVRRLYDDLLRGDVASMLEALDENVDWEVVGPPSIPFVGHWRGRDQVGEFFRKVAACSVRDAEHHRPEVRDCVAQGDKVIAVGHDRLRSMPHGREYDGWWVHVFTLRDGKIVAMREYFDTAASLEAFGEAMA